MTARTEIENEPERLRRWSWFAVLTIVALTAVVPLLSPLLGRTHFFDGDIVLRAAPWSEELVGAREGTSPRSDFIDGIIGQYAESRERLSDGDFPERDVQVAGGGDLLSTPSSGLYSPLAWPYLILPLTYAPVIVKLLELATSIGGMWLLGRRMGFGRVAALVGGFVYAFTGFQTMWTTWPHTMTGAALPWLFWSTERLLQRRQPVDVAAVAGATAFVLVGGFPAVAAYGLYSLAAYAALRTAWAALRRHRGDTSAPNGGPSPRGVLRSAFAVGAGVTLGVGIVARVMVPFYVQVSTQVLQYRSSGLEPVPRKLIATAGFPHAFGVLNQHVWFGPMNDIEGVAYIGVAAMVLALVAISSLVVSGWNNPSSIHIVPAAVLLAFLTIAVYLGGPPLDLLAALPGIAGNPAGRIRSVIGLFAAVLAAAGAHALLSRSWDGRRARAVQVTALAAASFVGGVAFIKIRQFASVGGRADEVTPWLFVGVGAGATVAALWLLRPRVPAFLVAVLVMGALAVETAFFVVPFFPSTDPDTSLVATDTHRYLADVQDDGGRLVASGLTMYPGTTRFFGLDSLTGHVFHTPEMKEYLTALDPKAFAGSETFSLVDISTFDRISSPLLDRASADLAVLPVKNEVFGRRSAPLGVSVDVSGDAMADGVPGALRGFDISFPPGQAADGLWDLVVEVRAPGAVVGRADTRISGFLPERIVVPFAGEDLGADSSRTAAIFLEDPLTGRRRSVRPSAVVPVIAQDDGLKLVHVGGAATWKRETALPRFRFAAASTAVVDAAARLDALAHGVDRDVVVVNDPGLEFAGGEGSIEEVDAADPDRMTVGVTSEEGGWVVVADALTDGWSATVGGASVDVVAADHAFAAVRVPAGTHEVVFDYQAPGTRIGNIVSLLSVAVLAALIVGSRLRRSRGAVE